MPECLGKQVSEVMYQQAAPVGLYQGVDVRRNGPGLLEQTVRALKVARHDILDLSSFQVEGCEMFPARKAFASCQRSNSLDGSVGRFMDQSRHGG